MGVHAAAPPRMRPRAASLRARACACAKLGRPPHPRRHVRAPSRRRLTAGGSARRRSPMRRRSTRTSARGTPRLSPRCTRYAPPSPARAARRRARDALGGVVGAARAVVRGGTAGARVRVCAQTCGHAHARVCTCVGIAARSKDGLHVCMHT